MNNAVNSRPLAQSAKESDKKYISNLLCACAEGQVFVLGMNQCISQKEMHAAGSEKHSRHLKHGVHFPLQRVLLSLSGLYNVPLYFWRSFHKSEWISLIKSSELRDNSAISETGGVEFEKKKKGINQAEGVYKRCFWIALWDSGF